MQSMHPFANRCGAYDESATKTYWYGSSDARDTSTHPVTPGPKAQSSIVVLKNS
jgi:hypothetical protein